MSIGHFQICDCFPAPSLYSSITFPSLEHLQLFLNCFDMFRVLWGLSHICSILFHPVPMFPQSSFDLEILWRLVHHLRPYILLHLDSAFHWHHDIDQFWVRKLLRKMRLNRTECQPSMKQYLLSWLTCLKKASNHQVGLDSNLLRVLNERIQIHLACSFLWAAQPWCPQRHKGLRDLFIKTTSLQFSKVSAVRCLSQIVCRVGLYPCPWHCQRCCSDKMHQRSCSGCAGKNTLNMEKSMDEP